MSQREGQLGSSFRDPSGFVFVREGTLFRQVNEVYKGDYEAAKGAGLYEDLTRGGLLLPFEDVGAGCAARSGAHTVLQPVRLPMVSYPYEWCFGQLRDAALLTLDIAMRSLERGLVLKDASAYNVQFWKGKPVFIDHLSFERYVEGEPWVAYKQFCQHFLAPLALMSCVDDRLVRMLRVHLDGIPLDLASKLLPSKTRWRPGLAAHIHLHSRTMGRVGEGDGRKVSVAKASQTALLQSLKNTVLGLRAQSAWTVWGDYYANTSYSHKAMEHKHAVVRAMLERIEPRPAVCWDLGANTAEFSRIASGLGIETVAWDFDSAAVQKAYDDVRQSGEEHLLPLLLDLTNPSPSLGWDLHERDSVIERGQVDVVLALALVHHLAIGNNVPLPSVAAFLAEVARWAVVEFVPKDDVQVKRLLRSRKDVFGQYDQASFESAFAAGFETVEKVEVADSPRTLYLFRRCD